MTFNIATNILTMPYMTTAHSIFVSAHQKQNKKIKQTPKHGKPQYSSLSWVPPMRWAHYCLYSKVHAGSDEPMNLLFTTIVTVLMGSVCIV